MGKLLERLQAADETTKWGAIVLGTAVSMIAIVFVWVRFFGVIHPIGSEEGVAAVAEAGTGNGISFLDAARAGVGSALGALRDGAMGIPAKLLGGPKEYIIKP